ASLSNELPVGEEIACDTDGFLVTACVERSGVDSVFPSGAGMVTFPFLDGTDFAMSVAGAACRTWRTTANAIRTVSAATGIHATRQFLNRGSALTRRGGAETVAVAWCSASAASWAR